MGDLKVHLTRYTGLKAAEIAACGRFWDPVPVSARPVDVTCGACQRTVLFRQRLKK